MKRTCLFLCIVFLMAACQHTDSNVASCDTVVDDYGQQVVVPSHPARVVSTSPAITEIIFALGAQQLLVGRTDFCAYPPEAAEIESIGGISNLNVEKIVSLRPDLVLSGSMIPQKSIQQLLTMGVPAVCVIEKKHFDGLYENIARIGSLIGYAHAADSLNTLLRAQEEQLRTSLAEDTVGHRPTVYYVVGYGTGGNFTAGGSSFINDIITLAGGDNIAKDLDGWSYSMEALVSKDPDYIIVRREDSATFCRTHPYDKLSAVRSGHIIGIESGTLDLQVPRNMEAIKYLYGRLH